MNRLIQALPLCLLLGIVALAALIAAGPTIATTIHAVVPLVAVLGVLWICLELVRYYVRR
jgi:hypothetical protein